jgi:hypothetical protein
MLAEAGKEERVRVKSPGWLVDIAVAALLALVAVAIERQTQGRLASGDVAASVGAGAFFLLRGGSVMARSGRTLGCGFVFLMTWLLPCTLVLIMAGSPDLQLMVRNSVPLFAALGLFLLLIMVITFERIRLADVARFGAAQRSEGGPTTM